MAPCGNRSPTTCTRSGSTPISWAGRSATSCSGSPCGSATSSFRASAMPSFAPRSSRTAASRTSSSPTSASASGSCPATRRRGRSSRRGSSSRRLAVERSTGPGRHDFEIVADAGISLEEDMARRDFTINAIAKRLETGELVDPLHGRDDLTSGVLRTTSPTSFRDDPLRIVRGLRFVSQLGVDPDEDTLRQMREWAPQIEHVSGERIGGGLAADGLGELSKLLLGEHPAKALRLARDTGVLVHAPARVRACDRLRPAQPLPRPAARRAHLPRRPGRRGRRCAPLGAARRAAARRRQARVGLAGARRQDALLRQARTEQAQPRGDRRRPGVPQRSRASAIPRSFASACAAWSASTCSRCRPRTIP